MPGGGAKPGERRGGRKKGTPNKLTADVRIAILAAFQKVGGPAYLARIAESDPKAFCTLLGKSLPTVVQGDENGGPIRHAHELSDDRLADIASGRSR